MFVNGPAVRPQPTYYQPGAYQPGAYQPSPYPQAYYPQPGYAPTTYGPAYYPQPVPPRAPSILEGGPAGADIAQNLKNFGTMVLNVLKDLFAKAKAAIAQHV